ncbi:isopentenyl diphosphate isomerase/L-lactate dehydrogenase-like FMN-dependent dehydrogenase [Nitrobacteraceae bacterium AZCC 2146]
MRSKKLADLLTIDDMLALARRTLPRTLFDFVDGAAGDEATAFWNSAAFQTHALIGSALTEVSTSSVQEVNALASLKSLQRE